jgi:hypothetical protein
MTNEQLNSMIVSDLRELNSRVIAYIKFKNSMASGENKSKISVGMTVTIKTNNPLLLDSVFTLEKINKKNAVCRDIKTQQTWNVLICNVIEKP